MQKNTNHNADTEASQYVEQLKAEIISLQYQVDTLKEDREMLQKELFKK